MEKSMRVYNGVADYAIAPGTAYGSASCLTIGNFDGVHRGHQALIRKTVSKARALGVPAVVFTFEPHPLAVLRPELKLKRLFDGEDRRERLAGLGVDVLVVEPFSRAFSQLTPEQFLLDCVLKPFQPRAVIVGYDFSFGANRAGSIDFLRTHLKMISEMEVVSPFSIEIDGQSTIVSSTRIRQALATGKAEDANLLLGRPYTLRGRIKKGKGRGKTIGIPTANLDATVESSILPGVYAAWAGVRGRKEEALVNIGKNPTFETDAKELHIEAHMPNYDGNRDGDIYGEVIELEFVKRIRDEKKFGSVDELVKQVRADIQAGLILLATDSRMANESLR
jgi:riboflavin kinase/FMN adenylyltransferase